MRVVLGFQTRDVQHIPVRFDTPFTHGITVRTSFHLTAVGNHGRRSVVTYEVIILNHLSVSHHLIWQQRRQVLSEPIITTPKPAPFFTLVLETIHVDGDRCSGKPQDWTKRRVGAVAN